MRCLQKSFELFLQDFPIIAVGISLAIPPRIAAEILPRISPVICRPIAPRIPLEISSVSCFSDTFRNFCWVSSIDLAMNSSSYYSRNSPRECSRNSSCDFSSNPSSYFSRICVMIILGISLILWGLLQQFLQRLIEKFRLCSNYLKPMWNNFQTSFKVY